MEKVNKKSIVLQPNDMTRYECIVVNKGVIHEDQYFDSSNIETVPMNDITRIVINAVIYYLEGYDLDYRRTLAKHKENYAGSTLGSEIEEQCKEIKQENNKE